MTDKSDLKHSAKLKVEEEASLADDPKSKPADHDQTSLDKNETTRPSKAAKSKREIMEELSRERFPWEE